jgi:hypothetical protein
MMSTISFLLINAILAIQIYMPNIWIDAKQFRIKAGEKASVQIFHREKIRDVAYSVKKADLVKATLQSKKAVTDLMPMFTGQGSTIEFSAPDEGTYLVGVRSIPAMIELSADSINAYAKDNDLEDVKYARISKQQLEKGAKVMASWYAGVLLQAGATPDETFRKGSGYPLEIVPEKNPYGMKAGEKIRFTILWNGKPLFGARVIVRITADNNTGIQHIYSGKDGVIEVPLGSTGTWVVNVAKMVPSRNPDADWQAYQSSLSFGF